MGVQGLGEEWLWAPDHNGKLHGPYPDYSLRIAPGTGLWIEKNTVCSSLYNRDLSQAVWVKTNCTAAQDQIGQDVYATANAASSLTATAGGATCLQTITRSIRDFRVSAYVKRLLGVGDIEMTVDGGSTWTAITGSIHSADYSLVSIPYQNLANPEVGFRIATSGDAIAVDFFQCQDGRTVDTPVMRDTDIGWRSDELPTFNTTGSSAFNAGQLHIRNIMMDTVSSYFFEVSSDEEDTTRRVYGSAALGEMYIRSIASGGQFTFGNQNTGSAAITTNLANQGLYNYNRVASVLGGGGCKVCLNGGAISTNSSKARWGTYYNHIGFANNGGSTQAMGGNIRRMAMWMRELDDGELQRMTS